jgi:hypothetical protein
MMALVLSAQEQAALAEYQSRLLAKFPQRIRRIALFGSNRQLTSARPSLRNSRRWCKPSSERGLSYGREGGET